MIENTRRHRNLPNAFFQSGKVAQDNIKTCKKTGGNKHCLQAQSPTKKPRGPSDTINDIWQSAR